MPVPRARDHIIPYLMAGSKGPDDSGDKPSFWSRDRMTITFDDIRDWSGRVLTRAKQIIFKQRIQPICFVYPAQDGETQTKVYPGIDSTGNLQADITAVSISSGMVPVGVGEVDREGGIAGNAKSTAAVGSTGETWMINQIGYVAAAARTPVAQADGGGYIYGSVAFAAAGSDNLLSAPCLHQGGVKIEISGGDAADTWSFQAYRIA